MYGLKTQQLHAMIPFFMPASSGDFSSSSIGWGSPNHGWTDEKLLLISCGFNCEDKKSIVVGLSSVRICFPVYFCKSASQLLVVVDSAVSRLCSHRSFLMLFSRHIFALITCIFALIFNVDYVMMHNIFQVLVMAFILHTDREHENCSY